MDADVVADPVLDRAELVEARVAQPDPGVGHVAGLHALGRRPRRREVGVDDVVAVARLEVLDAFVALDAPVRTSRADATAWPKMYPRAQRAQVNPAQQGSSEPPAQGSSTGFILGFIPRDVPDGG